jgi:hypothetical protein
MTYLLYYSSVTACRWSKQYNRTFLTYLPNWTKRLRREMGERLGLVSGTEGEPDTERF